MNRPQPKALPRRRARGISLIEVLVVLVLFSFGLIGVVGLQARSLQYSMNAEDSNRAAMLANEMVSAMWVNQNVILPATTLTAWNTAVGNATDRGLPNGVGTVVVQNDTATITVSWRAPHEPSTALHTYTTHVRLVP
jgi:type IV pilus assembly protein PilV